MKKKVYLLIIIFILILGVILFIIKNGEIEEYTPEEEISSGDINSTEIILYYFNKENNNFDEYIEKIDNKKMILNPYEEVIKLFIEKSYNSLNKQLIFEKVELENYCLNIFFKTNNLENVNIDEEKNIIEESLNKTLTQFNEIAEIKVFYNEEKN